MQHTKLGLLILFTCITMLMTGCNNSGTSSDSSRTKEQQAANGSVSDSGDTDTTSGNPIIPADAVYEYSWNDKIKIASTYDNKAITIAANLFTPQAKYAGQLFPAVIFINSWSLDEYEYLTQAIKFAEKGYLVLSYSCRGWGFSGGQISMWGPEDRHDLTDVVNWIIANTPVDAKNIAASGISYGGMGSMLAATFEPRIKTCAALSPCIDMFGSMFSNETPRLVWGTLLLATSMGRLSPWILDIYTGTMTGQDIDFVYQMSTPRTVINYVDMVNKANKPIYISQNFGDYMFFPDFAIDYFNKLTVNHKRLDLNQGTHASHEGIGLLTTTENDIWNNVHAWMDYWLKGIDSEIIKDKNRTAVITMMRKGSLTDRIVYDANDLAKTIGAQTVYQWPANSIKTKSYNLIPRNASVSGKLWEGINASDTVCQISSAFSSGASMGLPLVTEALEDFGILYTLSVDSISREHAIIWETEAYADGLNIRGSATIQLNISLSDPKGQIILYLYDVNESGMAAFITHTFKTYWNAHPGELMKLDLSFLAAAFNVKPGHRLMLAMDTSEPLYGSPTLTSFEVQLHHSSDPAKQMALTVPYE